MSNLCPRIWVGCLAAYNAGALHGEWLTVTDYNDVDELYEAVKTEVLATSPEPNAEEWFIADSDEFGDGPCLCEASSRMEWCFGVEYFGWSF